jgi:hypothetical protein
LHVIGGWGGFPHPLWSCVSRLYALRTARG